MATAPGIGRREHSGAWVALALFVSSPALVTALDGSASERSDLFVACGPGMEPPQGTPLSARLAIIPARRFRAGA
jgi:hypothetical protein